MDTAASTARGTIHIGRIMAGQVLSVSTTGAAGIMGGAVTTITGTVLTSAGILMASHMVMVADTVWDMAEWDMAEATGTITDIRELSSS